MELYRNLRGEMVKKRVTNSDLSELLKVHPSTIGNKFHNRGNSDFTISEAILIQSTYFPGQGIEELFKKEIAP